MHLLWDEAWCTVRIGLKGWKGKLVAASWYRLVCNWFVTGRLGRADAYLATQGPAWMAKHSQEAEMLLSWSVSSCWAQRYRNHVGSDTRAPQQKPAAVVVEPQMNKVSCSKLEGKTTGAHDFCFPSHPAWEYVMRILQGIIKDISNL